MPSTSEATIVYVSDGGLMLGNVEGGSVSLEFGWFSETLTFRTWPGGGEGLWWAWWGERVTVQGIQGPGSSPARLEAGMEIGTDAVWGDATRTVPFLASTSGSGAFYSNSGFLGVRVFEDEFGWNNPDALPYYGWIRVEHDASAGTLTVHDWAWNSVAGEPILAGAIPEPRVYALGFGAAVLGFALLRRWRRGGHKEA